jgi:hypothetical protein
MKRIKKSIIIPAALLLLLSVQLSAQRLPSSPILPSDVRNLSGILTYPLSSAQLPSEALLQSIDRPVLTAWGDVDTEGTEGNGGTDNPNAYNDAPVPDGLFLLAVLIFLYGLAHRFHRVAHRFHRFHRFFMNSK